jgi:hypothetical protein
MGFQNQADAAEVIAVLIIVATHAVSARKQGRFGSGVRH